MTSELERLARYSAGAGGGDAGLGFHVARSREAPGEYAAASAASAGLARRTGDARLAYFARAEAARVVLTADAPRARSLYEALARDVPQRAEAWVGLARVARNEGRHDDAWRALETARACPPAPDDDP